jgi:WD40 repeat protein
MRRRDFIKAAVGAIASSPARWKGLGATAIGTQAPIATNWQAHAQIPPDLPIEIVAQTGHADYVNSVAISPDGRTLASASDDQTLKLWSIPTGRLLRTLLGRDGKVSRVAFSPDGRTVVSLVGVKFGRVRSREITLWETSTGRELLNLNETSWNGGPVFSPDGRTIVTLSPSELRFFDIATGGKLRSFTITGGAPTALAFSPDGTKLVVASSGFAKSSATTEVFISSFEILETATGRKLTSLAGHGGLVRWVAFAPDGRTVVSSGATAPNYSDSKETVIVWDASSGDELRSFVRASAGEIALSPDGQSLLSASSQGVKLLDLATGREVRTFKGGAIGFAVAFSPDGGSMVSANADHTLKLWDLTSGREVRTFAGFSGAAFPIAFSPDGNTVVSRRGAAVKFWDSATGRNHRTLRMRSELFKVAFSPDGQTLALGGADLSVRRWDVARWRELSIVTQQDNAATAIAYSPDGTKIVTTAGNMLMIWDGASGRQLHALQHGFRLVAAAAFSTSGQFLASAGEDYTVRLWHVETGREVRILGGHRGGVSTVAVSPDDSTISSGSFEDDTVRIWDVATGRELRTLRGHTLSVTDVLYLPDGRTVLSGSSDKTFRLWDAMSGEERLTINTGHTGTFMRIALSPDGRTIVSASDDGTIRHWRTSGEHLATSVASDSEWLTITPEGFFDSSDKGADLLNVVRGLEVYTIEQFYQQLYRPDVVRQKLATDEQINARVKVAARNVSLAAIFDSKAPPQVAIIAPKGDARLSDRSVTVEADLIDQGMERGGGVGRIEWRVNDVTRAVHDVQQVADGSVTRLSQRLLLPDGASEIKLVAYNKANLAASLPASISVRVRSPIPPPKPRLHVLSVGVNEYRDTRIARLENSVADARSVAGAFALSISDKKIYDEVIIHGPLLDADVTAPKLAEQFERLSGVVRPDDVFVFYLAGHGVTDDGRYYFVPHDARLTRLGLDLDSGIGQDQLQQWLTRIAAFRSVLIYDTCESGSVAEERTAFRRTRQLTAAEKLNRSIGRTVLSATSDVKSALEGYEKHGAFTYILLDALALGDANRDGVVTTAELGAYLSRELPALSERLWNVRQEPQVRLSGAPFPLVSRAEITRIDAVK